MSFIYNIVGARPNFMKIAPVVKEMQRRQMPQQLVHTGQHYDSAMSDVFFKELGMPNPDIHLGVGSGSHAEQTAKILVDFEKLCLKQTPSLVVVGGDVNSTLACGLAAAKLNIPVAHVESGLRSFDREMPEEINRVLTDHLSSLLFTTEPSGNDNLKKEGVDAEKIHFVGNSMIDSLRAHLDRALEAKPWRRFGFQESGYGLVTLHRPSNTDGSGALLEICTALREIAQSVPLLFPVHPRTRNNIAQFGIDLAPLQLTGPLGYLDFLGLMAKAKIVLTDSGGVQEETTALRVPCVTIRENTERPVTTTLGTNHLAGVKGANIISAARQAMSRDTTHATLPPLWDGHAAERIVDVIEKWIAAHK